MEQSADTAVEQNKDLEVLNQFACAGDLTDEEKEGVLRWASRIPAYTVVSIAVVLCIKFPDEIYNIQHELKKLGYPLAAERLLIRPEFRDIIKTI